MKLSVLSLGLLLAASGAWGQRASEWVGSWAASQQIPEPANALPPEDLTDTTLRQIVHLSAGGQRIRLHISNAFGTEPLRLLSVHVAKPLSTASSAIATGSDSAVQFAGKREVTIPAWTDYVSDPVAFPVAPGSDLMVSIHYSDIAPAQETGHPGSRATSYLVRGDMVSAAELPGAKRVEHWYQLSGVDVSTNGFSIVALGDSITDGHGATNNGNDRWPDVLARRLRDAGRNSAGVLNQGIGGNHLLTDGLGPNALARLDRDVLTQTAAKYLIVLEGVNDLGGLARTMQASPEEHARLVEHMIAAYEQIVARAHALGLIVIGGTITPYVGSNYYHPDAASEADRQAVNQWIRTPGHFDAVIDFDQVIRDPEHVDRMQPKYDSGDHLHPSPAGYAAMAGAIPLSLFGVQ